MKKIEGLPAKRRTLTHSLWVRIMGAFFALPFMMCFVFFIVGFLSFDWLSSSLIERHMKSVIYLLVQADEMNAGGSRQLAESLKVSLYASPEIPVKYDFPKRGLHAMEWLEKKNFVYVAYGKQGKKYVLVEKIKTANDIGEDLVEVFWWSMLASLAFALITGFMLSRHLVSPLVSLSGKIAAAENLEASPLLERHDEVGDLARSFVHREQALNHYLQREQMFTGDVSHELRTPLTVMQSGLDIIEGRLESMKGEADLQSLVTRMQKNLGNMSAIVHTLLIMARKPNDLDKTAIPLERVLHGIFEEEYGGMPENLSLVREAEEIHALGDGFLARMLVRNLLENACKYADGSPVCVRLANGSISFRNGGESIPEETRARIFENGFCGKANGSGSGLGLSLVYRACEHMGWRVDYAVPPEGGNEFIVHFPGSSTGG